MGIFSVHVRALVDATQLATSDAAGPVVKASILRSSATLKSSSWLSLGKWCRSVLNHWDFTSWNQLLADNIALSIRLGTAAKDSNGDPALLGMKIEYKGRDAAKKALREIYGDLHKEFQVTTEIARGPDVVLLGELVVSPKGKAPAILPIAVHMAFNQAGKIERMEIFSVDVRALAAACSPPLPSKIGKTSGGLSQISSDPVGMSKMGLSFDQCKHLRLRPICPWRTIMLENRAGRRLLATTGAGNWAIEGKAGG